MPRNNKFIVIIVVAVVLLAGFGVGLFFLIKKLNKPKTPETPKTPVYSKPGNNGAATCQEFCTDPNKQWGIFGPQYAKAVSAKINGVGGVSIENGKTYTNGQVIDINERPGALYPNGDTTQPAFFNLDCGCSN